MAAGIDGAAAAVNVLWNAGAVAGALSFHSTLLYLLG